MISYSKYAPDRNRTDTVASHLPGDKIIFEPGDRLFTFSFMSTDYHNTALNRFRYKLEGWNDDRWHMFEDGNKLLFNSLPPGEYDLRVQVSTTGADWGTNEWQTPPVVLAPWYRSVWFFILSILSICVIFYAFYRYRLSQILKIQHIRNGISADMHDESVKAGSDEINDLFARMLHFGGGLAESKGFTFHFETDAQLRNLKLDTQNRKTST